MIKQQGEVKICPLTVLPDGLNEHKADLDGKNHPIIAHSEKGHHHVIEGNVELLEPPVEKVPAGMRIVYAIVNSESALIQNSADAHERVELSPGIYSFRIQREYNPFLEEARMVND